MSAFWEWGLAIFACVVGLNLHLLQRVVRRQQDQISRLTRRVLLLEGSPRGDA